MGTHDELPIPYRYAHTHVQIRDGAALCEFFCWLEGKMGAVGGKEGGVSEDGDLTEISAADKLQSFRM